MIEEDLQQKYAQGENISLLLREEEGINHEYAVEVAYDLQSGSYVKALENPQFVASQVQYIETIVSYLKRCLPCKTLMEAGVGEATTFSKVLQGIPCERAYGFDISWSRIAVANKWLEKQGQRHVKLCTGSLLDIPFLDGSIDVVYTAHSMEPNHGNEEAILKELYRVAGRYLVLFEPGYEFASEEAKERMERFGYVRGLYDLCKSFGWKIVECKSLEEVSLNHLNPTMVLMIEKEPTGEAPDAIYACPKHKSRLEKVEEGYYSPKALRVYPTIKGVPCLRVENGILASKYMTL